VKNNVVSVGHSTIKIRRLEESLNGIVKNGKNTQRRNLIPVGLNVKMGVNAKENVQLKSVGSIKK
jgi:hypothetical protein